MSDMKEFAIFALKVAATILILNQVPALNSIIQKNYFAG